MGCPFTADVDENADAMRYDTPMPAKRRSEAERPWRIRSGLQEVSKRRIRLGATRPLVSISLACGATPCPPSPYTARPVDPLAEWPYARSG